MWNKALSCGTLEGVEFLRNLERHVALWRCAQKKYYETYNNVIDDSEEILEEIKSIRDLLCDSEKYNKFWIFLTENTLIYSMER